jgi:phage baseplate assembly protein gpV
MKRKTRISSILAGLGLLILAGCFNPLTSVPEPGDRARGGVTIHVSGTPDAARTLYPKAEFSKIVLSFSPKDGQTTHKEETLPEEKSSIVIEDLADGTWEVTAKGYVKIDANGNGNIEGDEEFEAASSSPVSFTVSSGNSVVEIPLTAVQDQGAPGYFSYSVSFPPGKVDTATLRFTDTNENKVQDTSNQYINQRDLTTDRTGTISLNPGYYLVRIVLQNAYQQAGRTEIVHVYSNMETRADYSFTEADFTDFILLSGTAIIKINGSHPYSAPISADEVNPNGGISQLGYTFVYWQNDADNSPKDWEIAIPSSSLPREVTFEVYASGISWETGITIQVSNADIPNIAIVIDKQTITLSGNANFKVGGVPASEYQLAVFDSSGNQLESGYFLSQNWSLEVESINGDISFGAMIYTNDGSSFVFERNVRTITVSGTANTDIALSAEDIQVKDVTVSVTQGATPVSGYMVYMLRSKFELEDLYDNSIVSEKFIAGSYNNGDTSSVTFPVPGSASTVWFFVRVSSGIYRTTSGMSLSSGSVSLDLDNLEEIPY